MSLPIKLSVTIPPSFLGAGSGPDLATGLRMGGLGLPVLEPASVVRIWHCALAETGCEAVEFATLEWVDWFNNRRLLEPIGNILPVAAEQRYYSMLDEPAIAA